MQADDAVARAAVYPLAEALRVFQHYADLVNDTPYLQTQLSSCDGWRLSTFISTNICRAGVSLA